MRNGPPVYFTDFLAVVDRKDFELVAAGGPEADAAAERIAESLDGVDLYFHAGPNIDGDVVGVTLADLICHRIIPRVTLHKSE